MGKNSLIIGYLLFVPAVLAQQPGETPADSAIQQRLRSEINNFKGVVSLYAKNLDTGEIYGFRQNDRVRTASTIKLAIMVTVFDEVDNGHARWTDLLPVTDKAKVSGSGVVRELSGGVRLPIKDLVHLMIVVSDNTATNLLLDRFPADKVNATMERLGFKQTRSLRKILGDDTDMRPTSGVSQAGRLKENESFGIGVSTPLEMVTMLEMLERGQVVNPAASKEMIAIMKRQQLKDGIARRLGAMTVASKSGSLDHLRSDVGIVYSPAGRVAIAATCDDIPVIDYSPDNVGDIMISKLTGILLNGMQRNAVLRRQQQRQATDSSSDR